MSDQGADATSDVVLNFSSAHVRSYEVGRLQRKRDQLKRDAAENEHLLWLTKQAIMDSSTSAYDLELFGKQLLEEMKHTCMRLKQEPNLYFLELIGEVYRTGEFFRFLFQLDMALVYGVKTGAITEDFSVARHKKQLDRLAQIQLDLYNDDIVLKSAWMGIIGPERRTTVLEVIHSVLNDQDQDRQEERAIQDRRDWMKLVATSMTKWLGGAFTMTEAGVDSRLLPSRIFYRMYTGLDAQGVGILSFFDFGFTFRMSGSAIILWILEALVVWVTGERIDGRDTGFGIGGGSSSSQFKKGKRKVSANPSTSVPPRGADLDISGLAKYFRKR
jgi:hypothetical protein